MIPELVTIGPWTLGTHDVLVVVGAMLGALIYRREAQRRGEWGQQHAAVAAGALFFGAVVAKLGNGWRYLLEVDDPTLLGLLAQGGKSVLGGLAGAYLGAVIVKKMVGVTSSTGDLFAPAVPAAMAVGRIGCLLTEPLGTASTMPWAVTVPAVYAARIPACPQCLAGPVHPSFIYEIIFQVMAFVLVVRFRDRIPLRGELFKLYLLGYGIFRFFIEFVRGNPTFWLGLSGSQLFLLVTVPLLAVTVLRHWRAGLYQPPPAGSLVKAPVTESEVVST